MMNTKLRQAFVAVALSTSMMAPLVMPAQATAAVTAMPRGSGKSQANEYRTQLVNAMTHPSDQNLRALVPQVFRDTRAFPFAREAIQEMNIPPRKAPTPISE